jgi:hypothetical protein
LRLERKIEFMKSFLRGVFLLALPCAAWAQSPQPTGYRSLHVDAGKVIGQIRSFQGLNGQPTPVMAGLPNLVNQYKALHVNLVRTHDTMGPADVDAKFDTKGIDLAWLIPDPVQRAAVVEAGNKSIVFPDLMADPEKPESYNFWPTDKVFAAIRESGAGIYYRVGRSWGANVEPPADFDKYAEVVKHIAMHYNQGWARGFHYNIRYWELWNEPDGLFWSGTPQQFYQLYEKTARALKSVDPSLKVGGVGIADAAHKSAFREGLLDYCAAHKVPFDFYSWHVYTGDSGDSYDPTRLAINFRALLDKHGFPKAENILSEWNLIPDFTDDVKDELQGPHNAAFIGSVLSYLQDSPLDAAMFYRGDAAWMGLFDLEGRPFKNAYAFEAMGKMQETPKRFAVQGTDTFGFAALAGRSGDSKTVQIFISNYAIPPGYKPKGMTLPADVVQELKQLPLPTTNSPNEIPIRKNLVYRNNSGYNLTVDNLPWGKAAFTLKRYRISKSEDLQLVEERPASGDSLKLSNPFPTDTVELIVLQQE